MQGVNILDDSCATLTDKCDFTSANRLQQDCMDGEDWPIGGMLHA